MSHDERYPPGDKEKGGGVVHLLALSQAFQQRPLSRATTCHVHVATSLT